MERRDLDLAGKVDLAYYTEFIKPLESLSLWNEWQEFTFVGRKEIARHFIQNTSSSDVSHNKKERIAFIYPNYSGLAHEQQMVRNIRATIDASKGTKFEGDYEIFVIYAFGDSTKSVALASRVWAAIPVNFIFLGAESFLDAGVKLDALDFELQFQTLIYVSVSQFAFPCSLLCRNPNQKFIQLKYPPRQVGRFSEYGFVGSDSEEHYINQFEENWLALPILSLTPGRFKPPKKLDKQAGATLCIGSISRIEKASHLDYQTFILKILNTYSNVRYCYTGKDSGRYLLLSQLCGHERSQFHGWVDPESYMESLDIYLEPFPWGGGDMTLLAFQFGLPYLVLETDDSRLMGIAQQAKVISDQCGSALTKFSFCTSLSDLEAKIELLVNSAELRRQVGEAWRCAVHSYKPERLENWFKFLFK